MKSKVSVVIPAFNREKTIKRAIYSVLRQTYKNIEIIVVDDCSTDGTVATVNEISDKRVRIVQLEKNGGACKARNRGIDEAKGEYIAFQDSDDEWLPEKLETQLETLKKNGTDVDFCAFNRVVKRKVTRIPDCKFKLSGTKDMIVRALLKENFVSTQTILAKRDVFRKIKFDETLPRFQDWDLAIRLAQNYRMSYTDNVLVNVFIQNDSITKSGKRGLNALEIIYKKYKDLIDGDQELTRAFLYKKCILGYKAGVDMQMDAAKYLRRGFDLKVAYVYLWSKVARR